MTDGREVRACADKRNGDGNDQTDNHYVCKIEKAEETKNTTTPLLVIVFESKANS